MSNSQSDKVYFRKKRLKMDVNADLSFMDIHSIFSDIQKRKETEEQKTWVGP